MSRHLGVTALWLAASALVLTPATASTSCEGLAALWLPHATITSAQSIPAGTFTPPGSTPLTGLPAFCRVEGVSSPTRDSEIGFELWIPRKAWNAKYLQIGNLVYAGNLPRQYGQMATALRRGYAAAANDGGNTGGGGTAAWAVNHPEKIIDWAYRAHKETADKANTIIKAYKRRAPERSYFYGASTGGRDALAMAQRYPDDFDGVVVEGAAIYWTRLAASWVWTEQALRSDPASFIPPGKLPAIQSAVVAACDALDGIVDGIVADPRRCHFDPKVLQCAGIESESCLTAPQVEALKKIMGGPRNPRTGERVFPGYEAGTATDPSWALYILAVPGLPLSGHAILGNTFFANMVFDVGDEGFDFRSVNFDSHIALADSKPVNGEATASVINATDPDLGRLKRKGGKIIMFHGWEDPVIPARAAINYYESVIAAQTPGRGHGKGEPEVALRRTQDFFRLFLAPGMSHFQGGTGPDAFGSLYGRPGLSLDRKHDVLSALEAWVERDIAPDRIIAAKYVNDDPASGVARTRPLCPYPQVARWKERGSTDEAKNFECIEGRRGAYLHAVVIRPAHAK